MTAGDASDLLLERMTWEDAADALGRAAFAALPRGATEQHSTHLPLSVDAIRGERITREFAAAALKSGLEIVDWLDVVDALVEREFGEEVEIHSSEVETSTMEVYRPNLVIDEEASPHRTAERHRTRPYAYIDEISERGGLGDPTRSGPDAMQRVLDEAIETLVADLRHDVTLDGDDDGA